MKAPKPFKKKGRWFVQAPDGEIVDLTPTLQGLTKNIRENEKPPQSRKPKYAGMKTSSCNKSFKRGVGDYFAEDLSNSGFTPTACNRCKKTMDKMNELGPHGCREKEDELVAEVMSNAEQRSWVDKIKDLPAAARLAANHGTMTAESTLRATLHDAIDAVERDEAKAVCDKVACCKSGVKLSYPFSSKK